MWHGFLCNNMAQASNDTAFFNNGFEHYYSEIQSVLDKSSYVVGHVMALYSPDWTNIRFSFIFLTVNLFRHPTLIEHGLYSFSKWIYSSASQE